jgi:sigma-B regulation protein RsbU (phosphoserine phosphatase)
MDYLKLDDIVSLSELVNGPNQLPVAVPSDGNEEFRVLVVDDSSATCHVLCQTLVDAKYQVEHCSNAIDAIRIIESCTPHFVVSDWQMPAMAGDELCRWLRKWEWPHYIFFVMITAHDQSFNVAAGLGCGADDYIQKPVQNHELLARLRNGQRIIELHRRLRAPADFSLALDVD